MSHAVPLSPRARRHDDSLRRITHTAMRMIEKDGLEALSINKLAAAVDYTPGALYRYFASRDALLATLVERVLADVRAAIDEAIARLGPRATPLGRAFAIVRGYCAFARREPHRFGLLAVTMADPRVLLREPDTVGPVALASLGVMGTLADALRDGERAGQLAPGDAAERTVCVFALVQGVLQLHKQARFAPLVSDVERLATLGTRALLIGWGAGARAVDRARERVAGTDGDA